MSNGIYKIAELYEDYEELCKKLKIKPKSRNDGFIDHFIGLKALASHGAK